MHIGTVYHGRCIETWLNNYKHTCPLCKGPITAQRKKRAAARRAERRRLLAASHGEFRSSYGAAMNAGRRGRGSESGSAAFVRSI